jgi:ABC-2 type transport system permease protein
MTLVGPLLMALIFVTPVLLTMYEDDESAMIQVIDESGLFAKRLVDTPGMRFSIDNISLEFAKEYFDPSVHSAILYIPGNVINNT